MTQWIGETAEAYALRMEQIWTGVFGAIVSLILLVLFSMFWAWQDKRRKISGEAIDWSNDWNLTDERDPMDDMTIEELKEDLRLSLLERSSLRQQLETSNKQRDEWQRAADRSERLRKKWYKMYRRLSMASM